MKILSLAVFRILHDFVQNMDQDRVGTVVLPDHSHFSLRLCMPLNYRLHQVVDSTEMCTCLNGGLLSLDSLIIMTPLAIMTHTIIMTHKV